jgi:hypothetical protein
MKTIASSRKIFGVFPFLVTTKNTILNMDLRFSESMLGHTSAMNTIEQ